MVSEKSLKTVILTGPTAVGKSAIAYNFCLNNPSLSIEIINADSLTIYRHLDIGTAKPNKDELFKVPHHLINIRDPGEMFTSGDFFRAVHAIIQKLNSEGKRAIIVGGTPFYIKALLFGLWDTPPSDPRVRHELELRNNEDLFSELSIKDPKTANRIGHNDRYRLLRAHEILLISGKTPSSLEELQNKIPDPQFVLNIVDRPSNELMYSINKRTDKMLADGLIEETREVRKKFSNCRELSSVGYLETCRYLDGESPSGRKISHGLDGLKSEINLGTRQLVKRQRTWFKQLSSIGQKFILDEDQEKLINSFRSIYF